jgi:hypothetical protein
MFLCHDADTILVALATGEIRLLHLFVDIGKFESSKTL